MAREGLRDARVAAVDEARLARHAGLRLRDRSRRRHRARGRWRSPLRSRELAERDWEEAAAIPVLDEAFNQWLGAIERLRWAQMDKPLRAASRAGPDYPRAAAGDDRRALARALGCDRGARLERRLARRPSATGLIPWAAYLRGRGLNPAADALGKATTTARQRA